MPNGECGHVLLHADPIGHSYQAYTTIYGSKPTMDGAAARRRLLDSGYDSSNEI
jgi:hypothetical protein